MGTLTEQTRFSFPVMVSIVTLTLGLGGAVLRSEAKAEAQERRSTDLERRILKVEDDHEQMAKLDEAFRVDVRLRLQRIEDSLERLSKGR